jgi:hypothetical protein
MHHPSRRIVLSFFITIACSFASAAHAAGPTISIVSYPSNTTANVAAALSADVSSAAGVKSCNLYIDSQDVGAMTIAAGKASTSYTFPRGGVFTLFVFCRDNAGGFSSGPNTSILVGGTIVQQPAYGGQQQQQPPQSPAPDQTTTSTPPASPTPGAPASGSLVKLDCPDGAAVDDPCKAVYYIGKDGKRHAFPNTKIYFTWYADFGSVTSVTPTVLGNVPLGKNVLYRPGAKMVKFTTDPKVYAVGSNGALRWITSEDAARSLYGDDWNTKIDDVPDTFYTNYTFGKDVATTNDFNAMTELNAAKTINDML